MVGSIGETELASVGVAIQIFFIHWMMLFGFTGGAATFVAQFFGVRDFVNIRKTVGLAVFACLSVSLPFFACGAFFPETIVKIFTNISEVQVLACDFVRIASFTFLTLSITVPLTSALRATHQTRIPLFISAIALCLNTFLCYVFIFGNFGAPELGVAGAALATVFARIVELLLLLFVIFARKNIIAGRFRDYFGWMKDFAVKIVNVAVPTMLNETLWGLGMTMYTAAYARMGITAYASVQACNVLNNLFILAAFSMGDAALILVGQKLGAGDLEYGYALAKKLLKIGTAIGFMAGICLIMLSKPLIHFFDLTPQGQRYAFYILLIYGLTMGVALFNAINITGILRAGGDTRFAMISETLCVGLIGVPLAFISSMWLKLPIYLVVLLVKTEEIVKLFILLKRFMSKKWVKNVIHNIQ